MGFVLLDWVGKLGFLVSKNLTETISCSYFSHRLVRVVCSVLSRVSNGTPSVAALVMTTVMIRQKGQDDLAVDVTEGSWAISEW